MKETMEYRSVSLAADGVIDTEARTVSLGVTSEEPVYRAQYGMDEVIDHSEGSMDLSFAASSRMPLLLDHDPTKPVAIIEEFKLDPVARQTRAIARFGRGALASEAYDDVVDGIRTNVSVGYLVQDATRDDTGNKPVMRVKVKVLESSLVSIPADQSQLVGVGRSNEIAEEIESEPETKSEAQPQERIKVEENKPQEPPVDLDAVRRQTADEIAKAENERRSEIDAMGSKYQERDLAHQAIMDGKSIEEFRGALLEATRSGPVAISKDIDDTGLTPKEVRNFSLLNWINAASQPTNRRAQENAAFELEAMSATQRNNPFNSEGSSLPPELLRNWNVRDVNTSDDSGGVGEDFLAGDFIAALRNSTSVMQAGATVLSGLNADVKIPKQTGTSTATWASSEGAALSESELTLGSISLSPKGAGLYTEVTAQMLSQASGAGAIGIEQIIRNDILSATSLLIDLGATAGSGSSGQPTGIDNTTNVNAVTLTSISNPTWSEAVECESLCLVDNAVFGNPGYIANATAVGNMKTKVKESGQATYVMSDDGRVNGHRVIISNNVTAGSIYFSVDWSSLLLGFFGNPSLLIDPYTSSATGTVRLRVLQFVDVGVRVPQAFTVASGGS